MPAPSSSAAAITVNRVRISSPDCAEAHSSLGLSLVFQALQMRWSPECQGCFEKPGSLAGAMASKKAGVPMVTDSSAHDAQQPGLDYGDRPVPNRHNPIREKTLDKTLADSFPTSDPPSSIPDPCEDSFPEDEAA